MACLAEVVLAFLWCEQVADLGQCIEHLIKGPGCQRRTKTAPVAGATVHHLADFGRSKSAPFFGM